MDRWYFTFGLGYNLGRNFIVVEAETRDLAYEIFTEARRDIDGHDGRLYAFDYSEAGFAGQPERYGLTEVPIDEPIHSLYGPDSHG